jgi:hypothetical protein
MRRISGVTPRVKPKKTSADPGGLTTGKIAASTRRNVLKGDCIKPLDVDAQTNSSR